MAQINGREVLAIVDSTGQVWLNPDQVDDLNRNITLLYTHDEVRNAMVRYEQSVEAALPKAAPDYYSTADTSSEPVDLLAFGSILNKQ